MAWEPGAIYWICPEDNYNVALSVRGDSQVSQNRDVFLYTKEDIADQLWKIDLYNGFARIKSTLNEAYALNIYLSTGNCDIHTWEDNLEDSKINFRTIDGDRNIYRLQNYRNDNENNNLYLTASSTASGASVTWQGLNEANSKQIWRLIKKSDGNPGGGETGGGETGGGETGTGTGGGEGPYGNYVYPTVSRTITQSYSSGHPALDIKDLAEDHNVYAMADGIVAYTQNSSGTWHPDSAEAKQYEDTLASMGNCIAINHLNPFNGHSGNRTGAYARSIYMHLAYNPTVNPGDTVQKGQIIGTIGSTGISSGNHLHFNVSVGDGSNLAPGATGWIRTYQLPDFSPIVAFPEYHF